MEMEATLRERCDSNIIFKLFVRWWLWYSDLLLLSTSNRIWNAWNANSVKSLMMRPSCHFWCRVPLSRWQQHPPSPSLSCCLVLNSNLTPNAIVGPVSVPLPTCLPCSCTEQLSVAKWQRLAAILQIRDCSKIYICTYIYIIYVNAKIGLIMRRVCKTMSFKTRMHELELALLTWRLVIYFCKDLLPFITFPLWIVHEWVGHKRWKDSNAAALKTKCTQRWDN